jgi:Sigma-70 region 2
MLPTETALKDEALGYDFDKLFHDHHAMIYRVAYSMTGCHQDAEDVLQRLQPLYTRVLIPQTVADELKREKTPSDVRTWIADPSEWLEVRPDWPHLPPQIKRHHRDDGG